MTEEDKPKAEMAGQRVRLPSQRRWRILLGMALILGGVAGFLPVLGFWMIPLGIAVLAYDVPAFERLRRRVEAWIRARR